MLGISFVSIIVTDSKSISALWTGKKGTEMDFMVYIKIASKATWQNHIVPKSSVPSQFNSNLLCKFCTYPPPLQSCDFILQVATHYINLFLLLKVFFLCIKVVILRVKCQERWLRFYRGSKEKSILLHIPLSAAGYIKREYFISLFHFLLGRAWGTLVLLLSTLTAYI